MSDLDTLPGCIGYFPNAIDPNNCDICKARGLCKKLIAKSRLKEVLEHVEKIEAVLKGKE